jgi:hypothetical protein
LIMTKDELRFGLRGFDDELEVIVQTPDGMLYNITEISTTASGPEDILILNVKLRG